jgi:hypothetical protein
MADVSLDDLIKQDNTKAKAKKTCIKVMPFLLRSLLSKKSANASLMITTISLKETPIHIVKIMSNSKTSSLKREMETINLYKKK